MSFPFSRRMIGIEIFLISFIQLSHGASLRVAKLYDPTRSFQEILCCLETNLGYSKAERVNREVAVVEMKRDLNRFVEQLLSAAYEKTSCDEEYQTTFADEGSRKAQYIVDDLRRRELIAQLETSDLGYLSIGGADGSEVKHVLMTTDISKAVMIEFSDEAVKLVTPTIAELSTHNKSLEVLHGDATRRLDDALAVVERWCQDGEISGLVCSAQGVLHELPSRSPGFDIATFLGKVFRSPLWVTGNFYAREPCAPVEWPDVVRIRVPDLDSQLLVRLGEYVRDRLRMTGTPELLASNWVRFPAPLAVETLHKLIREGSVRRIGYELGEQLTSFDPMVVKRHLQSYIPSMEVEVEYVTTLGFKDALREYRVEYVSHDSDCLPVPKTHSEIIGFFGRTKGRVKTIRIPTTVKPEEEAGEVRAHNPFGGDVSDDHILKWLGQFAPDERSLIARLLNGFLYVNLERLRKLTKDLHSEVINRLGAIESDLWFVPLGNVAKSGGLISYFYRVENQLPANRFVDYLSLQNPELAGRTIVLLDDILASGHQAAEEWGRLGKQVKLPNGCRVLLATLVRSERGSRYVDERTPLEPCSAITLAAAEEPLDPNSRLFPKAEERIRLREIIQKYGERLAPGNPFGYGGSGLLVAFAHSTPDNTLPIFWSDNNGWFPLLRSGGSSRIFPER